MTLQQIQELKPKSCLEIPKTENMVKVLSLLTENDIREAKNMPFIIVSSMHENYLVRPMSDNVDRQTVILRDNNQQLVGLRAIRGG